MKLFPVKEAWYGAQCYMAEGFQIYQQFECESCKAKQTIDTPDKFYVRGKCQECGHVTDIVKNGCNYMAVGRNVDLDKWPFHKPGEGT